jgi:signal transduction histidine kinase
MDMFFDNNVNALCILDQDLRRVKFNPAYRELVGKIGETQALERGEVWEPLATGELRDVLSGKRAECEVKKEYGLALYSIHATPIKDDGNSITQLLVSIKDITNYQLMMENALFAERMSGVGMLASGIAHDIKGIFAVISNSNCTLKRMASSENDNGIRQKYQDVLAVQEEGLRHGRRLFGQLLSISGRKNEVRENFVLKECVENVVKIYNGEILTKNAGVTIRIRENIVIRGLQSKFIQVLMNLLANALEAIDNNGEIRLFEKSSPGRLRLCVEDNGCGIDETDRDAIFQAYYTTKRHGTGLGLFLVKNIAEEMGGSLTMESAKGVGTRFTMEVADNDRVTTIIK